MNREVQVRFCESVRVRFLCATRPVDAVKRALVLEDDPPLLAQIARLRLPPSPSNKGRTT